MEDLTLDDMCVMSKTLNAVIRLKGTIEDIERERERREEMGHDYKERKGLERRREDERRRKDDQRNDYRRQEETENKPRIK